MKVVRKSKEKEEEKKEEKKEETDGKKGRTTKQKERGEANMRGMER